MAASPIDVYRRQIEKELQAGNATEHTHRPALKTLLQAFAPKITATNEPKRVECGPPDFAVTEKRAHGPAPFRHAWSTLGMQQNLVEAVNDKTVHFVGVTKTWKPLVRKRPRCTSGSLLRE